MEWIVSRLVGMFHSGERFWTLRNDGGCPLSVNLVLGPVWWKELALMLNRESWCSSPAVLRNLELF